MKRPKYKSTYLKFEGKTVDILCKTDPSLKKYIIKTKSERKLIDRKLNKEIYGTLLGAIIF